MCPLRGSRTQWDWGLQGVYPLASLAGAKSQVSMPYFMSYRKRKAGSDYVTPTKRARQSPLYSATGRIARGRRRAYVNSYKRLNVRSGGFVGVEKKFYDTSKALTALTAPSDAAGGEFDPATVDCISAPAQGVSVQQRIGNKIMITEAHVDGVVVVPKQTAQMAADNGCAWVMYMVQDLQSNKATLDSEAVFKNTAGSGTLAASPMRNLQYSSRFRVLAKMEGTIEPFSAVDYSSNVEQAGVTQKFRLDWKGKMPVQFDGTDAGIGSVIDNSIHIIGYVSNTDLATSAVYQARVRYYDA